MLIELFEWLSGLYLFIIYESSRLQSFEDWILYIFRFNRVSVDDRNR